MRHNSKDSRPVDAFEEKMIKLNRVAKVVKGGRRFSFSALMVVGDRKGNVGLGYGKANEVPEAIRKGVEDARRNIAKINLQGSTIPHQIVGRFCKAQVLLKPAAEGAGLKAGSSVRPLLEFAGVKNILSKSLGSDNHINVARATFKALKSLMTIQSVAKRRGKDPKDIMFVKEELKSSSEESTED